MLTVFIAAIHAAITYVMVEDYPCISPQHAIKRQGVSMLVSSGFLVAGLIYFLLIDMCCARRLRLRTMLNKKWTREREFERHYSVSGSPRSSALGSGRSIGGGGGNVGNAATVPSPTNRDMHGRLDSTDAGMERAQSNPLNKAKRKQRAAVQGDGIAGEFKGEEDV